MIKRRQKRKGTFRVTCIWCGPKVRDDKEEETTGVCLKCFYARLANHIGLQKRAAYGEFVSDR